MRILDMPTRARLFTLDQMVPEKGYCWKAALPSDALGDQVGTSISGLRLFENGTEIGPGRSSHDDIRQLGGGRFSHWGTDLYFSSSDKSPLGNSGRTYQALIPAHATETDAFFSWLATCSAEHMNADQRHLTLEKLIGMLFPGEHLSELGRSMFLDTEFSRDYEKIPIENYRSYDRKFAMREFARLALKRHGSLAECGVYKGASAYILAKEIKALNPCAKLHLYDSFEGLSSSSEFDGKHWTKGDLNGSLTEVQTNLAEFAPCITYHKGWIPDCFDTASDELFSFVHIDVDLHEPTRDALAYFYPRMAPLGIIICDDYGFETCPGARKAVDEFFRAKHETVLHLPTGQGIVICGT
jgi:O-methyltransferase